MWYWRTSFVNVDVKYAELLHPTISAVSHWLSLRWKVSFHSTEQVYSLCFLAHMDIRWALGNNILAEVSSGLGPEFPKLFKLIPFFTEKDITVLKLTAVNEISDDPGFGSYRNYRKLRQMQKITSLIQYKNEYTFNIVVILCRSVGSFVLY